MPNDRVLTILKNQMDLLSGSHSDITDLACRINGMLVRGDEMNKEKPGDGGTMIKWAENKFDVLLEELDQQVKRTHRVIAEIEQLRKRHIS